MNVACRVVTADDHPAVRNGLKQAIEADPAMRVIGESNNGESAFRQIAALRPDVAVLDFEMPRLSGFGVARKLMDDAIDVPVIILTIHNDEDLFHTAMNLGIKGYLVKDQALTEIVRGLRVVADGKHYVSSSFTEYLITRRGKAQASEQPVPGFAQLTETQKYILKLVSHDRSSKDIGAELGIHHRTVENHRNNICRKLNLKGPNALLRFALAHRSQLLSGAKQ
jgi:DNA-binding NarL/FixJ family response regulator